MPEVKSPITGEQQTEVKVRLQSNERRDVASRVVSRFYDMRTTRNQSFSFFRNRSFQEYVEDSVKRINQFKEKPSHKKWWQANQAGPTTRNKLMGILSKLAQSMMEPRVWATNETDFLAKVRERVLNVLLKASAYKNKDDKKLIWEMFEAMAKGTVVGFEGWRIDKRKVRWVKNQNPETGETTVEEREIKFFNDVYGVLIPLEDMYFGDIFVSDVQDMDDSAWRQVVKFGSFQTEFSYYPDADLVQPNRSAVGQDEKGQFSYYQPSNDIESDEVEILRYFNKATDEYVMIANGIWINCQGGSTVQPIPFNHKKLPFWVGQFELIDSKFIYGKSLADKMIATQDTRDKFFDNILDRLTMALQAPIVVKGSVNLSEGYLEPDGIVEIKDPIGNESVERMDLKEPGQGSMQILQYLEKELENTSISSEVTGQGGSTNKTATQVQIEREGALELVSLFLRLMEFAIRDKYQLRLSNIVQFYTLPSHKDDKEERFRKVVLRDEVMSNGTIGNVEVEITRYPSQQNVAPTARSAPTPTERMEVTPEFIRDSEGEVFMVPRSSLKQSEALRQAQEASFAKTTMALFPDIVNRDVLFDDFVNKFPDKDSRRLRAPKGQGAVPGMEEARGGVEANPGEAVVEPTLRELVQ